jgi:hypothetical protein
LIGGLAVFLIDGAAPVPLNRLSILCVCSFPPADAVLVLAFSVKEVKFAGAEVSGMLPNIAAAEVGVGKGKSPGTEFMELILELRVSCLD